MFKKLFLLSIILILCVRAPQAEVLSPGLYHFNEGQGDYSVFVPTENRHKMIVALHGSGERARFYIENWLPEAASANYIVLAINSLDKRGWQVDDIERILERVRFFKKSYQVERTLLSGASSGGQFALYLGINHYEDFDAIAVFMGVLFGGPSRWINYQNDPRKRRPVYMVHGTEDKMIPVEYGRLSAKFLKGEGYPTTFIEVKGMDHRHWHPADKDIINWFEKLKGP
jgi:predicted esterase